MNYTSAAYTKHFVIYRLKYDRKHSKNLLGVILIIHNLNAESSCALGWAINTQIQNRLVKKRSYFHHDTVQTQMNVSNKDSSSKHNWSILWERKSKLQSESKCM